MAAAVLLAAGTALAQGSPPAAVDPEEFYAPRLLASESLLTFSIPVEVGIRGGRKSFVQLFERYGFSGNGYAIQQVVRHNLPDMAGRYNSEGDAFVLNVKTPAEFRAASIRLACVEDIRCLARWLAAARSIWFKE